LTATLTTILDNIRGNVISLPSATEAKLEEWVQQAQRKAEGAFQWIAGEEELEVDTIAGSYSLDLTPTLFLWPIGKPWWVTGDVGRKVKMEWLPSLSDRAHEYKEIASVEYRSSPKALKLDQSTVSGKVATIRVYPAPDASNIVGTYSTAGEYEVHIPYHSRGELLEVGGNLTNYLTENPDLATYIEEWAAGKAMLYNHDYDNGNLMLLQAKATLMEAKKIEKKRKVPVLEWTPRRDVHASRRQRRAV
jgi:hypothetical protein